MALREQQARMEAQQALEQAQAQALQKGEVLTASNYQQQAIDIALRNEVAKIRAMPTLSQRADYKRQQFLPKWLPFAEQHLDAQATYQNDVIGYCIVFSFDVGDFDTALRLAERAIANQQRLPEGFYRPIPDFVAGEILHWTEKQIATHQPHAPYFQQVLEKVALQWNVHEILQAKWYKLTAGLLLSFPNERPHPASIWENERLELAKQLSLKAFGLNMKVGVRALIERIEMRQKRLAELQLAPEPLQVGNLSGENICLNWQRIFDLLKSSPLPKEAFLAQLSEKEQKQEQKQEENNV